MSVSTESIQKEAKQAGLRSGAAATLEAVERRRGQLWVFAGIIIAGLTGGMVLLSLDDSPLDAIESYLPGYMIRVLLLGFAVAIGLYLMDKELKLRSLTKALVQEKVLSAALSNRLKEISLLLEVGKALNQILDTDSVLQMIIRASIDLLDAEECSIMLVDEESQELILSYSQGEKLPRLVGKRIKIGEGVAGWVAENREPLLIKGSASPERFRALEEKDRPPRSSMCVPLISKEKLFGVLNINDVSGQREFTEYDLRALGLFAEHAAIALRNARLFEVEKEAVLRLEELDRMKSEFIATVSHELRTPLTSIIGCAKTVRRRANDLTVEQRSEFLGLIETQGEKLLRMVEEILSASRLESGEGAIRRQRIDLVEVARQVIREFETAGAKTPIELRSPGRAVLFGDPMSVDQILGNLVENAVKYSADGSLITIKIEDEPGMVRLLVSDRGRGISVGDLPMIFERFRQVDQSNTRAKGGVGLGLYLVKRLCEAQGAAISVTSEVGVGSVFTVTFPKRKE